MNADLQDLVEWCKQIEGIRDPEIDAIAKLQSLGVATVGDLTRLDLETIKEAVSHLGAHGRLRTLWREHNEEQQSMQSKASKATTAQCRAKVEVTNEDQDEAIDSDDDTGPQPMPKVTDSWTKRHSMQSLTQPFLHPWFDDYKNRKGLDVPWTKGDLERGSHILWAHKAPEIGWAISMSECRELARAWLDRWHRGTRPAGFDINSYKIYKQYG